MDLLKIFISCSNTDSLSAKHLSQTFEDYGIPHFYAPRLRYKDNFNEQINENLQNATHILFLASRASLRSQWANYELENARKYKLQEIVVLLEPDLNLYPTFNADLNYLQFYNCQTLEKDEIIHRLIMAGLFSDGIVPAKVVKKFKKRFPHEVFTVELLTQPIFIRNDGGKVTFTVNRDNIDYYAISTKGKAFLVERYVNNYPGGWDSLRALDQKILEFTRNSKDGDFIKIDTSNLPLRWSSGGAVSVVSWRGRKYVPLFFRDIPPYGWNISLGASERFFDNNGNCSENIGERLEEELTSPWKLQLREFLEETLVLERKPEGGSVMYWRNFEFPPNLVIQEPLLKAKNLSEQHIQLRCANDGIQIKKSPKDLMVSVPNSSNLFLNVIPSTENCNGQNGAWNVLIAINPMELGVEVVNVFEYNLDDSNYILDGEIYQIGNKPTMVRMPVALISLEYLFRNFGTRTFYPEYTQGQTMPSVKGLKFEQGDIHVFRWDIDQRNEIWGGFHATEWEKNCFLLWQKNFNENFKNGLNGNTNEFPSYFTPTTCKILNLYFNCLDNSAINNIRF